MSRKPRKPKDPHAPKKPQNAYFIFMNERRRILKDENKGKPMIQISKLISNEWRTLTDKSKYKQQANKFKQEYNIKLNKYQRSDNFKAYQQKLSEWEAITSMTIKELKKELGSRSLKKSGNKSDLVLRLKNDIRDTIIFEYLYIRSQIQDINVHSDKENNTTDYSSDDGGQIRKRKKKRKYSHNDSDSEEESSDDYSSDSEEEYVPERIDNHRMDDKGNKEYYVKWENWDTDDNTWELGDWLSTVPQILIETYEQSLKKKKQIHESIKSAPNTHENINANDSAFITSRKRPLKERKCIPNQPKVKRQRINNNNVNNIDYNCNIEQTRMKVEEIEKLEKGDSIDHQCLTGKYMEAKIIGKWNSSWQIQYINNSDKCFSDYTDQYEMHKFAKYKSISNRPAHRLPHLTIGDNVYLNLKQTFARNDKISNLGWIKCVIQKRDIGQIQLKFKWKTIEYTYWVHLDDKEIISDDADWVEKHMKHSRYIPQLMRNQIASKQDWKCSCCDTKLNATFQIHHDIEVNKGGTNDMRNLRAINPECHINTHRNINGNNSNEVKCWLKDKCKLPQYFDTFIENDINDMEIVQELDKNDLQQMGIVSLGHQKKLLKYIKILL